MRPQRAGESRELQTVRDDDIADGLGIEPSGASLALDDAENPIDRRPHADHVVDPVAQAAS